MGEVPLQDVFAHYPVQCQRKAMPRAGGVPMPRNARVLCLSRALAPPGGAADPEHSNFISKHL